MIVKMTICSSSRYGKHPANSVYAILCSKQKVEWVGCTFGLKKLAKEEAADAAAHFGWHLDRKINDPFKGKRIL